MKTCQFCGKEAEDGYSGYLAMCMPSPEAEEKKKQFEGDWWKHLERTDLTKEEDIILEELSLYDQLLSTIGKGFACLPCLEKEDELLQKYYPKSEKND